MTGSHYNLKSTIFEMRVLLLILIAAQTILCSKGSKSVYTQVTFMYDMRRGDLNSRYKRTYEYYLNYFNQLLASQSNMIIFGGKDLEEYVWKRRKQHNTVFVHKELESYRQLWYAPLVNKIREKKISEPSFQKYKVLPAFALPDYNPLIMSKLYVMTEAVKYDKWNTDILVWQDGGGMHLFPRSMVSPQNIIQKYYQVFQPQWFFNTYVEDWMFVGWQSTKKYIGRNTESYQPVLASNMGGYIQILRDIKCAYQNFLRITLENGDMNSDESVLTLMPIRFPYLIPNTVFFNFDHMVSKLHMYEQTNRIPGHKRDFKGKFDKNGFLITKEKNMPVKSSKQASYNFSNTNQRVELTASFDEDIEEIQKTLRLIEFVKGQQSYDKFNFYKGWSFLTILLGFYLYVVNKNFELQGKIHSIVKTKKQSLHSAPVQQDGQQSASTIVNENGRQTLKGQYLSQEESIQNKHSI